MRYQSTAICGGCDSIVSYEGASLPDWIPAGADSSTGIFMETRCNSRECNGTEQWHHIRYIPLGCLGVSEDEYLEPDDTGLRYPIKDAKKGLKIPLKYMHLKMRIDPVILAEFKRL